MNKILGVLLLLPLLAVARQDQKKIQQLTDSLRIAGRFPGLSIAIQKDNQPPLSIVSGYADTAKKMLLQPSDFLLQGSVGKTYVAAIAIQLIKEGKLAIDGPVSAYFKNHRWFTRIPNADSITVRMLMNHTSGVMRYEFKEAFTKDLSASPDQQWQPVDLLQYIFDEKAAFSPGAGWEYSDTNYILLGLIIESITGKKYYELLQTRLLNPLGLQHTRPSDKRKLPGLIQGYAGNDNPFGGKNEVINASGLFIINPQFEWTGGGIYSTTSDLARWGKLLYEGKAFDSSLLTLMLNGVPAKLGRDTKYGLGVIIRPTVIGTAYGHSGYFPGYLTEMYYFPDHRMSVAVQANSSDFKQLKVSLLRCLVEIAKVASESD